jgi:5'-phosphate synthase pdxT subunit
MRVGVVAIQGDYSKHLETLHRLEEAQVETVEVRVGEELDGVDRLIIPGGESTTVGMLMERFGLGPRIQAAAAEGMPIWGTCMGMILMSQEILDRPNQYKLGILDVGVERNAFGAQVHSFESECSVKGIEEPVTGVFIRAPVVVKHGPKVEVLAEFEGKVVAVRQGKLLGTSFHPELTDSTAMHRYFLHL